MPRPPQSDRYRTGSQRLATETFRVLRVRREIGDALPRDTRANPRERPLAVAWARLGTPTGALGSRANLIIGQRIDELVELAAVNGHDEESRSIVLDTTGSCAGDGRQTWAKSATSSGRPLLDPHVSNLNDVDGSPGLDPGSLGNDADHDLVESTRSWKPAGPALATTPVQAERQSQPIDQDQLRPG